MKRTEPNPGDDPAIPNHPAEGSGDEVLAPGSEQVMVGAAGYTRHILAVCDGWVLGIARFERSQLRVRGSVAMFEASVV